MGSCRAPGEAVVPCRLRHHDKPDGGPVLRRLHGDGPVPCRPRDGDPDPRCLPPVDRLDLGRQRRPRSLGRPARARFRVGFHRRPRGLRALQGGTDRPRRLDVATDGGATAARQRERLSAPTCRERRGQVVRSPVGRCRGHRAAVALLRSGDRRPDGDTRLERTAGMLLVAGFAVFIPGVAFAVSSQTGTDYILPPLDLRRRSCCLPRCP